MSRFSIGLREQAYLPGETIIGETVAGRIETLVDILEVAGIDGEVLVMTVPDHLAAADV